MSRVARDLKAIGDVAWLGGVGWFDGCGNYAADYYVSEDNGNVKRYMRRVRCVGECAF